MLDVLGGVGRPAVLNEVKHYELFADGRVATVSLGCPDLVIDYLLPVNLWPGRPR